MNDREAVETIVKMISELDVLYTDTKAKLHCVLPVTDINGLYEKFYATELGDALKPLKKADSLLGEVNPLISLYVKGVIDEAEVVKRFSKLSNKRLDGVLIEDYINLAKTYMNAFSCPINSLDDIVTILSAKFISPEVLSC